jgi:hypothetical protein
MQLRALAITQRDHLPLMPGKTTQISPAWDPADEQDQIKNKQQPCTIKLWPGNQGLKIENKPTGRILIKSPSQQATDPTRLQQDQ